MTVIKRVQQNYNYPNSSHTSDTESLHLGSTSASDTESLNNEPVTVRTPFRPQPLQVAQIEEIIHLKRCGGRKKQRRYQNRCILQTLNEDEENENAAVIIMEPYKSPFTRLLEDDTALQYWNNFIEKSEEEQSEIMKAYSDKLRNVEDTKSDKPFGRISSKIKRTIKIRKNLSLEEVKTSEDDLISFFKSTPNEVYVKHPPTSFDRLLLHAIAQYHRLQSISVLFDGNRSVEICNSNKEWIPAECFLTDFIVQLRR